MQVPMTKWYVHVWVQSIKQNPVLSRALHRRGVMGMAITRRLEQDTIG